MKATIKKVENGYILLIDSEIMFFNVPKQYVAESLEDISNIVQKAFMDNEAKPVKKDK